MDVRAQRWRQAGSETVGVEKQARETTDLNFLIAAGQIPQRLSPAFAGDDFDLPVVKSETPVKRSSVFVLCIGIWEENSGKDKPKWRRTGELWESKN